MTPIASLPDVPGLRARGPEFWAALARMCERLDFGPDVADAVCALLSHESGFKADAVNPKGGASGIMQWIPSTARALGTTVEDIRKLSAIQQIPLVEKTFRPWAGKLSARDVPMVGFGGGWIGKPDETIAYRKGEPGYDHNAPLDLDKDGALSLGEVRAHVLKSLGPAATRPRLIVPAIDPNVGNGTPTPSNGGSSASTAGAIVVGVVIAAAVAWWRAHR